jgi:hypothetical protein
MVRQDNACQRYRLIGLLPRWQDALDSYIQVDNASIDICPGLIDLNTYY